MYVVVVVLTTVDLWGCRTEGAGTESAGTKSAGAEGGGAGEDGTVVESDSDAGGSGIDTLDHALLYWLVSTFHEFQWYILASLYMHNGTNSIVCPGPEPMLIEKFDCTTVTLTIPCGQIHFTYSSISEYKVDT